MKIIINSIIALMLLVGVSFADPFNIDEFYYNDIEAFPILLGATIYPNTDRAFRAELYIRGSETTARGDTVVWGYFYASPNDVPWGSKENPEVYIKMWHDVSGRIDVNFFHVSVPDIQITSADNNERGFGQVGTVTLDERYARHEYWLNP